MISAALTAPTVLAATPITPTAAPAILVAAPIALAIAFTAPAATPAFTGTAIFALLNQQN